MAGLVPAIHIVPAAYQAWMRGQAARFRAGRQRVYARAGSAFTRVHSPSKTGVNALFDALCPRMTMF